ncbi:uncharacterized protein [Branchiostoma lanceolatum]|uniref:uncharacterized protein n=1 Tax=Branchiostoma lanceolatum TaxID=7740 RepID=UPI003451F946
MFLELEVLKSLGDFYIERGTKSSDVSQFSKAAAMYKKALTRCGDPETKKTLHHRISYAEKTREAVRMRPTLSKSRLRDRRSPMGHTFGNITRSDVTSKDHHLHSGISSQYKDHLKKGESSLNRADLNSAEQHFAAALKAVHVPAPTAQQYQREVEPLCKLGDVYSKRGQQTGDGGDFVKAAALYNAAIARSEDQVLNGKMTRAITEVEKSFLKCIFNINQYDSYLDDTENHKEQLKEMRDQIKLEMETIDEQLDPYVLEEDDPCVKEIETKRAQAVRQLFENIAQQRKEFISLLVEECTALIGPPPCKYALIGLGSQATGLVTPYSDLEFAMLIDEESEKCLLYFRNLTRYLHLKVVNLGETILPAMGIKSLNDFYSENPLDNWYYDYVTPRGFAFDGSMPKASKTPLGRQGTKNKPTSELICTPENMASKVKDDVTLYLKEGYHLATILRNPCLIAGDQDLIDTTIEMTDKVMQADGGKMAQQLAQETQRENIKNFMYSNKETITAKLVDVKKKLYRFPALAVECLALSSHIRPTTIWETIEEMENKQVISPNNAHHLVVLTSISAELRLRTYIANGGQKENFSALASTETISNQQKSSLQSNEEVKTSSLKPVFHLPNKKQLFRYYYTAVPLKSVLSKWSGKNPGRQLISDIYDNSPRVQGMMYHELCKYRLAISYYREALKTADGTETKDTMVLLCHIGHANFEVGDHNKAISYYEQALKMHGRIHKESKAHPETAAILSNLGAAWANLGDQRKAISFHEQALQMEKRIYSQSAANPGIAISLNNLGDAWHREGDYRKAINYHKQALEMTRRIYGGSSAHSQIALLLNNLGVNWGNLGEHKRAVSYHEQALQMYRDIYGPQTAHPDIAQSFNNLGKAWQHLGNYRKAINYYEQALQIYRSIYGQATAHPDIAMVLNNIAKAWGDLGDYGKTISYYEQALQIYRSIYGQATAHPGIAKVLNNIGGAWGDLGDYRKALSYYEQALQMMKSIYGQCKAHPDIAVSLSNIGTIFLKHLVDYKKAISYFDKAVHIFRGLYGQSTAHRDIATLLNNIGIAWDKLGEHRRAVSYYEQALQMRRSVYGLSTAHPGIVTSLCNLGLAWQNLGYYMKAISYHEQALEMSRNVYGQTKAHPMVAILLNNLGGAWGDLGKHRRAVRHHEQALQMRRSIYGPHTAHPDIATSLNNLGMVLYDLGDFRAANRTLLEALTMVKKIHHHDQNHPMIKGIERNLAQTNVYFCKDT